MLHSLILKKLIANPLLHFLLIGAGLFTLYQIVSPSDNGKDIIVIDDDIVNRSLIIFEKEWGRPPTREELDGLIARQVKQEVLYRQALKMNLDHNDELIKRRMEQKLNFITNDLATMDEPTNAQLEEYYSEHQSKYIIAQRVSYIHIYFNPDKRSRAKEDAERILNSLPVEAPNIRYLESLGDPFPFLSEVRRADQAEIASQMGDAFAASVLNLPTHQWSGPVLSGYGTHLVYILEKLPEETLPLAAVKEDLMRDYTYDVYQDYNNKIYEDFKKQYDIRIQITERSLSGKIVAESPAK